MTEFRMKSGKKRIVATLVIVLAVSGCTEVNLPEWADIRTLKPRQETGTTQEAGTPIPVSGARSAEQLDTATASEKSAASSGASAGRRLGTTIATLGAPGEQGFWLKTPLVDTERPGVLRSRDTGKRVSVTLIPIDGPPTAGSRISLSAMRTLELPLTALAELDVSQGG